MEEEKWSENEKKKGAERWMDQPLSKREQES